MAHLVFQTAFPGDLFLSVPLIRRLRALDPENRIVLACRPGLGGFFMDNGLVDEVIEIDKRGGKNLKAAKRRMRDETWDLVLVPHGSFRTALWMWRLRATKAKVGFSRWWNRFVYDRRVTKPMHLPDALRQMSLLAAVDPRVADWFATDEVQMLANPEAQTLYDFRKQRVPEWASMRVKEPRANGRRVFLAPGSVWGTKRWTTHGYTDLARQLVARGDEVVLVGSGAEARVCAEIAAAVPGVIDRAGQTSLSQLVDELATGVALVCNDSGAMHAAAAAGLPTVAIFGPTTLDLGFRPWNDQAVVVQRELECRPCGKHGPRKCPIGTHACMEEISAADVLAALDKLVTSP